MREKGVSWNGDDLGRSRKSQMRVKKAPNGVQRIFDIVASLRCAGKERQMEWGGPWTETQVSDGREKGVRWNGEDLGRCHESQMGVRMLSHSPPLPSWWARIGRREGTD